MIQPLKHVLSSQAPPCVATGHLKTRRRPVEVRPNNLQYIVVYAMSYEQELSKSCWNKEANAKGSQLSIF